MGYSPQDGPNLRKAKPSCRLVSSLAFVKSTNSERKRIFTMKKLPLDMPGNLTKDIHAVCNAPFTQLILM